jgi:hypothetical protein
MPEEIIAISAILMPVFLVSAILGLRHLARRRELAHKERMAAIQAGLNPPSSRLAPLVATTFIGAGVPISAMFCAWFAGLTSPAVSDEFWKPCMMVAVTGIIAGTLLLAKQLEPRSASSPSKAPLEPWNKTYIDPDAYDVVSRRG